MSIVIDRLSVRYGRVDALREVTACASPGRITVVLGPNAAGKSTLLRACIGAIDPSAGVVLIDGEPAHRMPARKLARRAAYVPQRPQVSAAFTVRKVIELGRYALAPEPATIERVIDRFHLREIEARRFPELSVGQQQRVTVARAFAQLSQPGRLILDEPTSAMDLLHATRTFHELRALAKAGATVLLAMHDLTAAARLADDVWLLGRGRLLASGPADEIMRPDTLDEVFGVKFERITHQAGSFLIADTTP